MPPKETSSGTLGAGAGSRGKGGSALKRMKNSLKSAGLIGPNSKQNTSKKNKKKLPAGADREKEERTRKLAKLQRELSTPFELKTTNLKHDITGRKVKGVEGRPGLSKQVGNETRKKTLLAELERRHKSGGITDRRFGEKNPDMTEDEKMLERFTRERQKQSADGSSSTRGKRSLFNLEDEENDYAGHSLANDSEDFGGLTHSGRSLNDIDDYDLHMESDEDEGGNIDESTVAYDHFGGFEEKKTDGGEDGRKKTKNEIMKELVAKSKFHKFERQKQHEEDDDLVRELDDDLASLRGLLAAQPSTTAPTKAPRRQPLPTQAKAASKAINKSLLEQLHEEDKQQELETQVKLTGFKGDVKVDDQYDRFVRELALDRRSKPTDRLKTEEETAAEEKEALEKAERARKRRMEGIEESSEDENTGKRNKKRQKRAPTADDLDDDFLMDEEESSGLGHGLTIEQIQAAGSVSDDDDSGSSGDSDGEDEDNDDDESGEDVGDEDDDEEGDEEDDEGDDSDGDAYSDLDSDGEGMDDQDSADDVDNDFTKPKVKRVTRFADDSTTDTKASKSKNAPKELPFTFSSPSSLEALEDMFHGYSFEDQGTIIHRIRVMHHIKLAAENKEKMMLFLELLIAYTDNVASASNLLPMAGLQILYDHIVKLAKALPEHAATLLLGRLVAIQDELKTNPGRFPPIESLLLLRYIAGIFPTSDLVHPVTTPAMLLIAEILGQSVVKSLSDLAKGLFLCSLVIEYQSVSKRFTPEALSFLANGFLLLKPAATTGSTSSGTPGVFPLAFVTSEASHLKAKLLPEALAASTTTSLPPFSRILADSFDPEEDDDDLRWGLLLAVTKLFTRYSDLNKSLPSYNEVFSPIAQLLSDAVDEASTQDRSMPADVKTEMESKAALLARLCRHAVAARKPLYLQKHRAIALPTYLPKFEEGYSVDHHYDPDAERQALSKLKSQHKREKKGAVRELRRDAQFLNSERLKKQRERDETYKKKIRTIEGRLGDEEGALKKMDRMKEKEGKKK